jgi:hypothetical protein
MLCCVEDCHRLVEYGFVEKTHCVVHRAQNEGFVPGVCFEPGCNEPVVRRNACELHRFRNVCRVRIPKGYRCTEPHCRITGSFGTKGSLRCASHRRPGDTNYRSVLCVYPDCKKTATFGLSEDRSIRKHCSKHKERGEVSLAYRHCDRKNCSRAAKYAMVKSRGRRRCELHRLPDDVFVCPRTCLHVDCPNSGAGDAYMETYEDFIPVFIETSPVFDETDSDEPPVPMIPSSGLPVCYMCNSSIKRGCFLTGELMLLS